MRRRRFPLHAVVGVAILTVLSMQAGAAWAGGTSVAYSFRGEDDGEYPSTELVVDGAGNLYGTTVQGGDFGGGTVFRLSPTSHGWVHTVLYSFTGGDDGGQPYGGVTLDARGNLYGTAVVGGLRTGPCVEDGCGVAYELSRSGGSWHQRVLHAFTGGDDGSGPGAGLTLDASGDLFGMTPTGGAYGLGTIYQLRRGSGGGWSLRVLHAFTGGRDGGAASAGRLLLGPGGSLFGVATVGGEHGAGVAFELRLDPGAGWRLRTLYAFQGQPDAGFPYGGLTPDADGDLFGTTYYDGANDLGAVYELARDGGTWRERVLYSFRGGADGASPISTLVPDGAGNLYGTTSEGGAPGCGCGTIFRMARSPAGTWTESVAYRFAGPPDGAFAYNGMVSDGAGSFFGTTVHGGADNEGTVYRFSP
jgi:uncharacterized repeat protein (TIGR03803 family)